MNLVVAALLLAAAPATTPSFVGLHRINQMEMAGGLELSPDGRFRYAFDYGAVSEASEGKWSSDANGVLLTTDPMPPPAECDRGFASACFDGTHLTMEGDNLILIRWDEKIVLKPDQPRPR